MSGEDVGSQGLNDRLHRLVTALFERAEYGHQHRLRIGADFAPVAVAVLADDHCRTHLSLRVVVVERDSIVIEKRKQVGLVPSQALDQSPRLAVAPGRLDQRLQALRQPARREAYVSAGSSPRSRQSRIASPKSRRNNFANAGQSCAVDLYFSTCFKSRSK